MIRARVLILFRFFTSKPVYFINTRTIAVENEFEVYIRPLVTFRKLKLSLKFLAYAKIYKKIA